ncbi:MAG: ABC-type transport auxiliary lipoprotein family protein [Roseobacter sp.]
MIRVVLLCMAGLLAGCTGLQTLNRASTPNSLYALTPKSTFSASLPRISQQIVVEEPTASAAVNTDQIAVQPTPLQVQYLPGARWVDRAPLIVQTLLIESYENSNRVGAVGRSSVGLRADYVIVTDLREFHAYVPEGPDANAALQVIVRLNVKIVEALDDKIIASQGFREISPSESDAPFDLVTAYDEALGDAMRDAVEWSIRRISTHAATKPPREEFSMDAAPPAAPTSGQIIPVAAQTPTL